MKPPTRGEIRAMCVMTLAAAIILCAIGTFKGFHGETFIGRPLGGDFVQFYAAGRVLTAPHLEAARIYDVETMNAMEHTVNPQLPPGHAPVFGGAPLIAALFAPLTLLPYPIAYLAWLVICLLLAALAIRRLAADWLEPADRGLALLVGLSFPLLCFESWMGQISVLGLFVFSYFLHFLRTEKRYLAGFVLAWCAYKPSMLVFPGIVLLIRHRKEFVGFVAGLAVFFGSCFAAVGVRGMAAWAEIVQFYTHFADGTIAGKMHFKYLDGVSFFSLLHLPHARWIAAFCGVLLGGALLVRLITTQMETALAWAATLCIAMVATTYTPTYDGVLLIPAAILAAGAIAARSVNDRRELGLWLTALYIAAWITQVIAELAHFQILTLLIAAFGLRVLGILGSTVPLDARSSSPAANPSLEESHAPVQA